MALTEGIGEEIARWSSFEWRLIGPEATVRSNLVSLVWSSRQACACQVVSWTGESSFSSALCRIARSGLYSRSLRWSGACSGHSIGVGLESAEPC
jgi:hypothetical protein